MKKSGLILAGCVGDENVVNLDPVMVSEDRTGVTAMSDVAIALLQ
jgi:hypothetical protein